MQSLPLELKLLIVEKSSGSPNSLAALARTHTSFQKAAENALYHTLSIFVYNDSLKCMETLATNSEKAALVRFLTIEYASNNTNMNRKMATYLSKSLINMHSLSDLRVRSRPDDEAHMKGLDKILWSVCKNLIFSNQVIILLAIQWRSFSITNFLLPRTNLRLPRTKLLLPRRSQYFSNH